MHPKCLVTIGPALERLACIKHTVMELTRPAAPAPAHCTLMGGLAQQMLLMLVLNLVIPLNEKRAERNNASNQKSWRHKVFELA